jgi:hypothetical protein
MALSRCGWLTRREPLASHHNRVSAVAFSPDGVWIGNGSQATTAQLWRTPAPIEGSVEPLALWIRVVTRKELDESGAVRFLDLDTWQKLREELDRLGGPPDRPGAKGAAGTSRR